MSNRRTFACRRQELGYHAGMTSHELQEIFRELPAGPFVVHIAERTPLEVTHSDFASIAPGGAVLSVWDAEGHFHFIDALSITRITIQAPATRTAA